MLDLRTLWLTRPLDRYEATLPQRRAEQAVYPLLRRRPGGAGVARRKVVAAGHRLGGLPAGS
jgi:hypothetical protein